MRAIRTAGLILGFIGLVACGTALADPHGRHSHGGWHRGWHGGVIVGAPLFWPYYGVPYAAYPYGPYAYPYGPVVAGPPAAPEYVERGQERDAAPPRWYFCKDPKGYYPYVRQCPQGWLEVAPPSPTPNQ